MNWQQQWIDDVLKNIPAGGCRRRLEAELRDHLEDRRRALTASGMTEAEAQAEAMRAMGDPARLKEEYRAAWQKSRPGQLDYRLKTWAWGCVVMFGAHLLSLSVTGLVWDITTSLPGASRDPWVLNNSWLMYLIPLVFALITGAYYLGRKFQTSRHPVWQISVGLSFHWASFAVIQGCLKASDGPSFWAQLKVYFSYTATYYSLTFALCILLGVVFGYMPGTRTTGQILKGAEW